MMNTEPSQTSIDYIIDDNQAIRHAMELLMRSVGLDYEIFHSGDEFLASHTNDRAGCLVLDIRMPGLGGLELQDQVSEALKTDQQRRSARDQKAEVLQHVEKLTKRGQEVMDLVVTGKPNKVIAYELGVSQRTVEIHRARVMEKMEAKSLADLVRMHLAI